MTSELGAKRRLGLTGAALTLLLLACDARVAPDEAPAPASAAVPAWPPPRALGPDGREAPGGPGEIHWLDRTAEGDWLASSSVGVFRASDFAAGWRQVVEWDWEYGSALALQDGSGAYLENARGRVVWDRTTAAVTPISNLGAGSLRVGVRRGPVWLSYGGVRDRDAAGPEAVRPDGAGPGIVGICACSLDGGRTWTIVEEFEGVAVVAVSLEDDDTLTVFLEEFGVRRGRLETESSPPSADLETLVLPAELGVRRDVLFHWGLFDGDVGWMGAALHHGPGHVLYRSDDGGRSWEAAVDGGAPRRSVLRLADGRRLVYEEHPLADPPPRLRKWTGSEFELAPDLPPPYVAGSSKPALVDVTGDGELFVLGGGGELWTLDPTDDTWVER